MKREQLTNILGNDFDSDLITQILNEFHSEMTQQKELTQTEKQRADSLTEQLKAANDTIKNLEDNAEDNESIQSEIEGYKNQIKQLEQDLKQGKIDSYITTQLTLAGAQDVDICKAHLEYDVNKINSERDYGLIDQAIQAQKEARGFLYNATENKNLKTDKSEPQLEKKQSYKPRNGSGKKSESGLGKRMAEEIMNSNAISIS